MTTLLNLRLILAIVGMAALVCELTQAQTVEPRSVGEPNPSPPAEVAKEPAANPALTQPPVDDLPANIQPTLARPITGKSWTLSFSDEFNAATLDTKRWNTAFHWWSPTNQSMNNGLGDFQNNQSQMRFTGSELILRADKQPGGRWKTACITSMNKHFQAGGFFEGRLKLPKGAGAWPGAWLMRQDKTFPPEIDWLESNGHWPTLDSRNLHWTENGQHRSAPTFQHDRPVLSDDFHVYGVHWKPPRFLTEANPTSSPGVLDFYFDGAKVHTITSMFVPNQEMYILFSLEVSGGGADWPRPNAETPSPMEYSIDYVRAWR